MPRSEPYERLGARRLALPDLIAQSVGFMGPVFAAAFLIPLVAGVISPSGRGAGAAAPLSVLIAAIGVLALSWIVSSYARAVQAAGSVYDYVSRGLGARVGTAAGWLYYGGMTILLAGLLLLIGGYLQATIAAEFGVRPLPGWAWTLLAMAAVAAAGYLGPGSRPAASWPWPGPRCWSWRPSWSRSSSGSAGLTACGRSARPRPARAGPAFSSGSCTGCCCSPGSRRRPTWPRRRRRPRRAVPAAVWSAAVIAGVFLVLAAYAEVAGFHDRVRVLTAAAGAPLFALAAPARQAATAALDRPAARAGRAARPDRHGDRVLRGGVPGLFALARDRRVPAVLAIVSRRHGTPLAPGPLVTRRPPPAAGTSSGPACSPCRSAATTSRCSPGPRPSAASRWS